MALPIGTRLGSHEIIALLGKGGMGEVYRARDSKLKREVAIKLLPDHLSNDADRLSRFQREAEVLASLNHPNIAHVYGLEQSGQTQFIIMELVPGATLEEKLRAGAMPVDEALGVAIQVAEALESAHERGIIHRDLKPANIKLTPEGKVKVLDFGLAKAVEASPASTLSNSPTLSMAATQAGVILGTAAYMSPEQAKGMTADPRSDVFSYGCVLYEMLTGRQAFQFDTATETLAAILMREPDMSALSANVDPRLKDALRRCLEKNPKRRWQAVGDLRAELEAISAAPAAAAQAEQVGKVRPLWRRAIPFAISAVVFSAVAGIVGWSLRPPPAGSVIKFPLVLPDGLQMLTATASHAVSISPDGKWLLYLANNQIFLRAMSEMEAKPIAGKPGTDTTRSLAEPFFSPDSKWIGFYSREDATIKKIAITGGAAVTLCKTDSIAGASWEGDQILFARLRDKGIMRVSENGGEPEEVVRRSGPLNTFHGPQLVSGGKSLLFTSTTEQGEDRWDRADIVLQSLKTGERKILIHGGSDARYLPTGHLVYALGGTLFAVPLDLKKGAVQGGPVPILDGVMRAAQSGNTGAAHYAFSTNGTLVYVPGAASASVGSQRSLALADRNSGKTLPLRLPPQIYLQPRFSPDGSQLVFVTQDSRDLIVWVYDLKGDKPPRRLTFGGRNASPIWTRDGRSITFQSDRGGDRAIYQQRADGNGTAERLTTPDQGIPQIPESWSPDGRTLLFSSAGTLTGSIMTLSLDGDKKVKPLFAAPSPGGRQVNAAFSPDGRWFAYSSNENSGLAAARIFVEPFPPTGAKYELPDGGVGPVWSVTGKQLFYQVIGGNRLLAVDVQTAPAFSFGRSASITIEGLVPAGNLTTRPFDISPDGKQFAVVLDSTAGQTVKQPNPQINVVLNWFTELQQRVPVK